MTTMTSPQIETAEQLLERLLRGDPWDQLLAHGEMLRAELGGLTVRDSACSDHHGRALVLPLSVLWKHLTRVDSPAIVAARDGVRLHTPDNVTFGDTDDAYGPALGVGGNSTGGDES